MASSFSRRILARTIAAWLLAEPTQRAHWLKVLASYLVEQHRAHEADMIVGDIAHELYEQSGYLAVDVTSARPLSDTLRSELKHLLREATDAKTVALAEHTDPELLGGFIVRTPDAQLDASVRSQLKQLATIK